MSNLLDLVKKSQMREGIPEMHPGDTVRVHARIVEGNKERVQVFEGVIIRLRRGQNASSITVRRTSHSGIGVERTFMIHSPRIDRFEVVRRGKVRRAKLYYLRQRQGKAARIKDLLPPRMTSEERAAARAARVAAASTPSAVATPSDLRELPEETSAQTVDSSDIGEVAVAAGAGETEAQE